MDGEYPELTTQLISGENKTMRLDRAAELDRPEGSAMITISATLLKDLWDKNLPSGKKGRTR